MENIVIIGSGPAGLTAAIYSSRANLNPLVIAGSQMGGQLMITSEVENYPGFPNGVMGPSLMLDMRAQSEKFGTKFDDDDVTSVDFSSTPLKVITSSKTYEAKTVIIATGASAMWLNVPNEKRLMGKGISACATCDGAFFKDKEIAVVGGGDSAMEEASFLTRFASKVHLLVRRDSMRASKIMQDRIRSNEKIEIHYNCLIEDVLGENRLEGVRIKDAQTNTIYEMKLQGLFVAIGHKPNTEFLNGQITLDEKGYIIRKEGSDTQTNIEGVFVAGDVYDSHYRQAITAAGSGCKASIDAEHFLGIEETKY